MISRARYGGRSVVSHQYNNDAGAPFESLPPLADDALRLVALGGLGQIGSNCMVLEQMAGAAAQRVVIDSGASFSTDTGPCADLGVDLIRPSFAWLLDNPALCQGLVLTHGHEDHIGSVAYLARALLQAGLPKLRLWGSAYTLVLCERRFEELGVPANKLHACPVEPGQRFSVGSFDFEPIRVTHSILGASALLIHAACGTVVHSGDFKLDPHPSDGLLTDEARLSQLGDAGVRLLLSDSTNILVKGRSGSEQTARRALDRLIRAAPGRVVVGLFASNLHRIRALGDIAQQTGRRLCLLGRSLRTHVAVADGLGLLTWPSDLLISPGQARSLDHHRLLYLATGTQAEPRGALRRLATARYPELTLGAGDRVLLSSRVIPGNERGVQAMLSDLLRCGAAVHTKSTDPDIHVSGHAYSEEQQRLIELLRPQAFLPVHGTMMHLEHHAQLARQLGVEQVHVLHDGRCVAFGSQGFEAPQQVAAARVAVAAGEPIAEAVLRDRRQIGRQGVVFVAVGPLRTGQVLAVTVRTRGVPESETVAARATAAARAALLPVATANAADRDLDAIAERVRRAVRHGIGELLGTRPQVEVALVGW